MVEEIERGIYRIGVPLPENPLKELNCYFVRGEERDLIIDTGFNRKECRDALLAGLEELGSNVKRRDVFLTHFHADHSGLAVECIGPQGRIYITREDDRHLNMSLSGLLRREHGARLLREGFPPEELAYVDTINMAFKMQMKKEDYRTGVALEDGDVLRVGEYAFRVILVPGHTPGSAMLWEENRQIMFTGDHVLFDITPNITSWPTMKDSLGAYLDSLERVKAYPVRAAYPGHRKSGDYHQRVEQLLEHHAWRLNEAMETIRKEPGLTAYEIAARMTWQIRAKSWADFPGMQKYFAVRECLSHLDHLVSRGRIIAAEENGIHHYYLA